MEESKYLKKICTSVLSSSPRIMFAGIIDKSGKLLSGKKRESILTENDDKIVPLLLLSYIVEAIDDLNSTCQLTPDNGNADIEQTILVSIREFGRTVLVVIPINSGANRFLCIYLEGDWLSDYLLSKLIQNEIRN